MIYPLIWIIGLRFIENQLRTRVWKVYSAEEMAEEVQSSGFKMIQRELVAANSGWLVVGVKK